MDDWNKDEWDTIDTIIIIGVIIFIGIIIYIAW